MSNCIVMVVTLCLIVIPLIIVNIIDSMKNHRTNKINSKLLTYNNIKTCPKCEFPLRPPIRYINEGIPPFIVAKWEKVKIECPKCDFYTYVKVKIE